MTQVPPLLCPGSLSGLHFFERERADGVVITSTTCVHCDYSAVEGPPASRASDPPTSREAEKEITKSGKRETQAQHCLRVVRSHPGLTAGELGLATGLGHIPAQRRLSDLKNVGAVRQGEAREFHGHQQVTWYAENEEAPAVAR